MVNDRGSSLRLPEWRDTLRFERGENNLFLWNAKKTFEKWNNIHTLF